MGCSIEELMDESRCLACSVTEKDLLAMLVGQLCVLNTTGGGGGGSGDVAASGTNFCFTGAAPNQVFKLKNLDTAAANRIDAVGAGDERSVAVDVSSSC